MGFVSMKEKLVKMAAKKQCDGTMCPAGCCPEQNWFCCPDNMYCAATAADCPFVSMKEKLVKMAAKKQCDGTMCPAGHMVPSHCSLFTNFWWPFATAKKAKQARTSR